MDYSGGGGGGKGYVAPPPPPKLLGGPPPATSSYAYAQKKIKLWQVDSTDNKTGHVQTSSPDSNWLTT